MEQHIKLTDLKKMIDSLAAYGELETNELRALIANRCDELSDYAAAAAREKAKARFLNKIYIRGLIEYTNICKNDCFYCGIRRSNAAAARYRLSKEEILLRCELGYSLGFRTFVLQGGEDSFFTDEILCDIVLEIKKRYPECAVTLSSGERGYESFKRLKEAGADRYLLRHETADSEHYARLHPDNLTLENRLQALCDLKRLGYQVGCGFMVGSPYQTADNIVSDLKFIKSFSPQMVGIGPFIPHKDTPFRSFPAGSVKLTLFLLSIIRLMNPDCLLPATTALGTLSENGREAGILHGANVVMPNLSPDNAKHNYILYDNKLNTGCESAEGLFELKERFEKIGYEISYERGDYKA